MTSSALRPVPRTMAAADTRAACALAATARRLLAGILPGVLWLSLAASPAAEASIPGACTDPEAGSSRSLKSLRKSLNEQPQDPRLNYSYAVALIAEGRQARALEPLRVAARELPGWPDPQLCLAQLYALDGYRVPAILAASRFLMLESDSPRASAAADRLAKLVVAVETDFRGKVVLRYDLNAPRYEGDFGAQVIGLDMAVASVMAQMDPQQFAWNEEHPDLVAKLAEHLETDGSPPRDDFSRMAAVLSALFGLLPDEEPRQSSSFVESVYVPLFRELREQDLVRPLVYRVFSPLALSGAAAWGRDNPERLERFDAWVAESAS